MRLTPLVVTLSVLGLALPAQAAPPAKAAPWKTPRTVDGQPDLEGTWTNATLTPFERPASMGERKAMTPEEVRKIESDRAEVIKEGNAPTVGEFDLKTPCYAANTTTGGGTSDCGYNSFWTDHGDTVNRVNGEPRTSIVTFPANGRLPARLPRDRRVGPAPVRGIYGRVGENPEEQTIAERCITSFANHAGPVMLPSFYNSNYQIVQGRDSVAILVEMIHDVRIIRIGGEHGTTKRWYGDSVGHWEGDTLVVETINYNQNEDFRGSDANLKVTERFTRVGPQRLLYQFKVEDPTVWAQAWGGEYEFGPAKGPVYEYACHEGNYALEDILAGARAAEAEAKAKSASAAKP
ncbi:MAG TPA: hypothetical protein VFN88_00860 [Caulobacteraceae bacterium]|nr:hypothetical protein [Caulobacteraceae bacterium]